jgi:hypothetical protein
MDRCDFRRERTSLSRLLATLLFAAVVVASPRAGAAGTAINQLCGAAKLGSGCVGAFRSPSVPAPTRVPTMRAVPNTQTVPKVKAPRMGGGAFGGMGGLLMGFVLDQALSSALDADGDPAVDAAAEAQAAAAARQAQALQDAVRQQQQLQEEREAKLVSQLADRPTLNLLGGAQDLGLLETARAEAGSPFDGNDPHSTWTTLHDTWFSPDPTPGIQAGSAPVPTGDAPLAPSLRSMDCMGKLCAFPSSNPHVPTVKVAPSGPTGQPGLSGASTRTGGVTTEWRHVGPRVVWAARRDLTDTMETAGQTEIPPAILGSGNLVGQALPGMQMEIAREGRDLYQRIMEEMIAETFGVIADAVAGRWESARERSDTMGDRVRESILPQFKMMRLAMGGESVEAGKVAAELFWERATETAKERASDLLDALPAPDAVKDGIEASATVADHWLQYLRTK